MSVTGYAETYWGLLVTSLGFWVLCVYYHHEYCGLLVCFRGNGWLRLTIEDQETLAKVGDGYNVKATSSHRCDQMLARCIHARCGSRLNIPRAWNNPSNTRYSVGRLSMSLFPMDSSSNPAQSIPFRMMIVPSRYHVWRAGKRFV